MTFLMTFLTALVISFVMTPVAIKIAPKIGAVDIPKDSRRMHTRVMPRFGGLAIFTGTIVSILIFTDFKGAVLGIAVGGALVYVLGVIDDLKNMPAKVKFVGQIFCASVAYAFGVRITFITDHFSFMDGHIFFVGALSYIVTVIWIVGITNTINLLDGLDGLAGGISAIASLSIAYVAYFQFTHTSGAVSGVYMTAAIIMLAIAGGAFGFLPYNFHPAKIFMGDGGSLFLGFMLATGSAAGAVKGSTLMAVIIPVLVLGLPIFDTAFAILRRMANGRPIMEADKGHLHHRLMEIGLGQKRTVLMLYGISGIMSIAAILFSKDLFIETAGLLIIAATYIYIFITNSQHQEDKSECDTGAEKISCLESEETPFKEEEAIKVTGGEEK
ncbi:MAG: MraY family glycosyltransferase [Eubacteriales bacterium]|nr:MraY family glycosyltransferase [Eubacteriales bacterium]MDD4391026.1 MraY family glycosyltransferase [Eubacteriales bacterium]